MSPNFGYAPKAAMGDKPVNLVNFWDACRFCNWLHNGMPEGPQGAATTEFGAYDLTVQQKIDDNEVIRSAGAKFHLPTEDQWYKAAYHDPRAAASGGLPGDDNYWHFPVRSDHQGIPAEGTVNAIGEIINGDGSPIANYIYGADWDSNGDGTVDNGNVTTVGSGGPGSASFYGAFDMAGNVQEWNEVILVDPLDSGSGSFRGKRGGSWDDIFPFLSSPFRSYGGPGNQDEFSGFRVASP